MDRIAPEIETLVNKLHTRGRLRVWSIIISIFGDSILPHGGVVSTGTLGELTGLLGIDPGAMRSALSRLTKEGWLQRQRIGRSSRYSLTAHGVKDFVPASQRIYAMSPHTGPAFWTLAVTDRAAARDPLESAGFTALTGTLFIRASHTDTPVNAPADVLVMHGRLENIPDWARKGLADVNTANAFGAILADFAPLFAYLNNGGTLSPEAGITARSLLIHDWRRAVLRLPDLPPDFFGPDWPEQKCRTFVARLYRLLTPPAGEWLARAAELDPSPDPMFYQRFTPTS